jgi:predicted DNA-binding transcriptional regulator YafY
MRASRLLSIVLLLQSRGRVSGPQLARELEVSVRTIYRDMDELSSAGIPVYGDRGPGGGFELLQGYRTNLTGLTAAEAQSLLLAGFPQAVDAAGLSGDQTLARLKLECAVPMGHDVNRAAQRMLLDPVRWHAREAQPRFLQCVTAATLGTKRMRIRYQSWEQEVTRRVDPYGLVLKAGVWYLVAAVDDTPRTYRVDAIQALTVFEETFEIPAGFSLAGYWDEACRQFEQRLHRSVATVRVHEDAMSRLDMVGSVIAEAVRGAECDAGGWRCASIPIENIDHAAKLLLCLAPGIIVVAPEQLRDKIREIAVTTARLHDEVR